MTASAERRRTPRVAGDLDRVRLHRLAALGAAAAVAAAGAGAWPGGGAEGIAHGIGAAAAGAWSQVAPFDAAAATPDLFAATPDLVAPASSIEGMRADARFELPGTAWSARIESVAAFARAGVLREVPAGVRIDGLAALGDEVAIVAGARAESAFGASTPDLRPDWIGAAAVRPLVGARAAIPIDRGSGLAIDLDATPLDGGTGARVVYRTALDRAWRLELGVGVTRGPGTPWSDGDGSAGEARGAAWIGLRASF